MTHEFKTLLQVAHVWRVQGITSVVATVVALEGSSYRRPGVRMLIAETGEVFGAVSGGCVEKEIVLQAASVFKTETPKVITYDGRFRLGCEGVLYILIEPMVVTDGLLQVAQTCFEKRIHFQTRSFFKSEFSESKAFGTVLEMAGKRYTLNPKFELSSALNLLEIFTQSFQPIFQLYIFGAEHDAVQLCELASNIGWEVHIIAAPDEEKSIDYFKGAKSLTTPLIQDIDTSGIGEHSAAVLMSHSLNKDVQYLMALHKTKPAYLGVLGSSKRRERLFSEVMNHVPDFSFQFLESIHGPAGLHLGAETPAEIALSIIAEILSVTRNVAVQPLREKLGAIHD
ncbi:XdhC family protein [Formosa sp. A9]|uniref:XdhC family protein n=1 Tax=Formosa sp. A9 TaxID=3442641 RepID=UPI003EB764EA